jgi:hypothetical protein
MNYARYTGSFQRLLKMRSSVEPMTSERCGRSWANGGGTLRLGEAQARVRKWVKRGIAELPAASLNRLAATCAMYLDLEARERTAKSPDYAKSVADELGGARGEVSAGAESLTKGAYAGEIVMVPNGELKRREQHRRPAPQPDSAESLLPEPYLQLLAKPTWWVRIIFRYRSIAEPALPDKGKAVLSKPAPNRSISKTASIS